MSFILFLLILYLPCAIINWLIIRYLHIKTSSNAEFIDILFVAIPGLNVITSISLIITFAIIALEDNTKSMNLNNFFKIKGT